MSRTCVAHRRDHELMTDHNDQHHDHDDDMCSQISFFPWNEEWMEHFADMFNYKINFMKNETHTTLDRHRLYSEWIRR